MASEKIVINANRILGGKAGLLTEAAGTDRGNAAKVQGKPQADCETGAKFIVKVPAPATKG